MTPRVESLRAPSLEPNKQSSSLSSLINDTKSCHTASRTPSPTDDFMEVPEVDPPRKKGLLSSVKASFRRHPHSSARSNPFRLSNSSIGSSSSSVHEVLGHSGSGHNNLNLSKHAEELLRESDDPKSCTADIALMDDAWEQKSSLTSKSLKSDSSANSSNSRNLGRLKAYSKKKPEFANHSSHPSSVTQYMMDADAQLPSNSEHNFSLSDMFYSSPTPIHLRKPSNDITIEEEEEWGEDDNRHRTSSIASSTDAFSDLDNELDVKYNSEYLMANLGDEPSEAELCNVAAVRVKEVIREQSVVDRRNFAAIPQYSKTDFCIGRHLGKGSFSDVFEVTLTIVENQSTTPQLLGQAMNELDQRIQAKFPVNSNRHSANAYLISDAFEYKPTNKSRYSTVDNNVSLPPILNTGEGGSGEDGESSDDDLDKYINATFGGTRSASAPPTNEVIEEEQTVDLPEFKPAEIRRPPHRQRRVTTDLSSSMCAGSVSSSMATRRSRRIEVAMKCLRPQIRSDTEQFIIGVEDLVHETVMLSSLNHPNIIKIHGRASGSVSSSFKMGDGYFILLDKLHDTLDDRIKIWQNKLPNSSKNPPTLQQIKVAIAAADAMAHLHDHQIVFRDLKPANVGFDGNGVLKLFDFGFAVGLDKVEGGVLNDRAGTPRYMAPEVGLDMGYGLPADVYSFSILLWEIFALKKPFAKIKCAAEFNTAVFQKGERPKVGKNWPEELKGVLEDG